MGDYWLTMWVPCAALCPCAGDRACDRACVFVCLFANSSHSFHSFSTKLGSLNSGIHCSSLTGLDFQKTFVFEVIKEKSCLGRMIEPPPSILLCPPALHELFD